MKQEFPRHESIHKGLSHSLSICSHLIQNHHKQKLQLMNALIASKLSKKPNKWEARKYNKYNSRTFSKSRMENTKTKKYIQRILEL